MFRRKSEPAEPRRSRVSTESPKPRSAFFSYHAARKEAETGQAKSPQRVSQLNQQVRKVRWQHLPMIFVGISLLVCAVYITMLTPHVRPQLINRKENLLRDQKVYQDAADKILSNSVFNRSKLTIDTAKFEKQMKQQFPELSRAAITLPLFGQKPLLELVSVKPALFLTNNQGTFVIDTYGQAVTKTSELKSSADLNLPTLRDQAGLKVELGKGALSSEDVTFITTLVQEFQAKKITITELKLPPLASELQVKIDQASYYIKFSLLTNPRVATGQYFALKSKLDAEHKTPGEYVDSRVEEKVYYR